MNKHLSTMDLNDPAKTAKQKIEALMIQHEIVYFPSEKEEFFNDITRLSGDEIIFDETENNLLALSRAEVISAEQSHLLLIQYLREK